MLNPNGPAKNFPQPLDKVALALVLGLIVAIGVLLLSGEAAAPRVRSFTWQDRELSAPDRAFILTFSRPMNQKSVAENLRIDPPLPGKISWAGRRMAYTLTAPVPYGVQFQVQIQGARDTFSSSNDIRTLSEPFVGKFRSRDRVLVYLGVNPEEQGQLILYNLSANPPRQLVLTPKDLVVQDYEPYPDGSKILFAAVPREATGKEVNLPKLYTVSTGIKRPDRDKGITTWEPPGKPELVLDNQEYRNLRFDLSPNGKLGIVARQNLKNPLDFGLWTLQPGEKPQRLPTQPGGDFEIAPDGNSLALLQGQGVAILSLEKQGDTVQFLPQFEQVLGFAPDGSAAAMVKFNRDPNNPRRSLFLVTTAGVEKELFRTRGSILAAEFDPTNRTLYCLVTKLIETEDSYREEPYIAAIDINTKDIKPLVILPEQRDIQISLSPDGLALLFDQVVTTSKPGNSAAAIGPRTASGAVVTNSRLWLIPLSPGTPVKDLPAPITPERLPFSGLRPLWLQ
ncbi:MAG TPA: hypothetical protein IGS52_02995 [Oscillatoriaceae cyanobacterium M33_DOE_052]|uniref:SbsA Ig-like domain-containing protein n=1 Tax=Planktothricoides sp. SpSt-374 TaxID=2282167 RepID=A0A7C3VPU4_9CYAN|nr:hypothetical protein [Oscillatoriaceae cyanobacterium M33_DOE_052]